MSINGGFIKLIEAIELIGEANKMNSKGYEGAIEGLREALSGTKDLREEFQELKESMEAFIADQANQIQKLRIEIQELKDKQK